MNIKFWALSWPMIAKKGGVVRDIQRETAPCEADFCEAKLTHARVQ